MTSSERFQIAEALFNRLLEAPVDERQAILQKHTGDDPELRNLLERMLAREDSGADLSVIGDVLEIVDDLDDLTAGDRIGPYAIERKVGEGGMGIVYEARQIEPVTRRVALKLIKLGMDTVQILARFETERQLLARMQHPNIAVLYDAGKTEGGRPYFAMEYVDGQSIVKYCDQQRMPIAARVRLMLEVCNGVQHAHQKGVIHRDLKPGNIHVYTGNKGPRAKVIDFGIAKLADPVASDSMTRIGQVVGTPEYMSPEQLLPDETDIDTRTDVYALGMILFELLAGTLPARRKGDGLLAKPSEFVRIQPEADVVAKNRATAVAPLGKTLSGDLDWIVMRATHSDRDRRYSSAAELAQDICRYLDGEPVSAGPDSTWYRLRKFTGRNRSLAAAAAVALISLVTAAVTSTYFAIDAARARDIAEREVEIASAVNSFLNDDILAQENPYQNSDRELTLREAVDRAADVLEERFQGQPDVKAAIYLTLGDTYSGLIQTPKAVLAYQSAVDLLEAANTKSEAYFKALVGLAGQQLYSGDYDDAENSLNKLLDASPDVLPNEHLLRLQGMNDLGFLHDLRGDDITAIAIFEDAVDAHRRVLGEDHRETLTVMNNLGLIYSEVGDYDRARNLLEEVAELRERTLGAEDPDTILSKLSLGYILTKLGGYERAEVMLLSCMETGRRVLGEDHPMYLYGFRLLADVYRYQKKSADAERLYREALDGHRSTLGASHTLTLTIQGQLATLLAGQERHVEAIPLFEEIAGHKIESLGLDNAYSLGAVAALISSLRNAGRCEEAIDWSEKALPAARSLFEAGDETLAKIEPHDATCP